MRHLYKILITAFCVIFGASVSAQITVTFTGRDSTNRYHIPLDHVTVFDLDQLWEEVLYYPDTTLFLGSVGIDDYELMPNILLMQNVPNPFDGTTEFALRLPEDRDVLLEIYDLTGRLAVGQRFPALSAGTHLFQATLTSPQTYLLSAKVENDQMTIKMVNEGHGVGNTIRHLGMTDANGDFTLYLKDDKSSSNYPFSVGDEMKYTGYAVIDEIMRESKTIFKKQYNSETIPLLFDITAPTVILTSISQITDSSAFCESAVTASGGSPVFARGVCWGDSPNPNISNSDTTLNGGNMGSYTSSIAGLTPNTTYFVRAYATNAVGTSYYDTSFTTLCDVMNVSITGNSTINYGESTTLTATGANSYVWEEGSATVGTDSSILVTPTSTTTYTVTGTNGYGCTATANATVTVIPVAPIVATGLVSGVTATSATCSGEVTSDGGADVTERGISYSYINQIPTYNGDNHSSAGAGMGSFATNLTNLRPNTTYYVRAYAINSVDTVYGDTVSFKTNCDTVVVSIAGNTNIDFGGFTTLTASGASSYHWSTNANNPSVTVFPTTDSIFTVTGTNSYGCTATASVTVTVNYLPPAVITDAVSNITPTTATCGGHVNSNGGQPVTAQGVCWSSSNPDPTIDNSPYNFCDINTSSFSSIVTGLAPNTTYYVRAFAINAVNINYGAVLSFHTLCDDEDTTLFVTACDSYVWNEVTYTASGEYVRTFTKPNGCDSVVTLHLTINHSTTAVDTQVACDSYTWIDGVTYTESTNTPTYTLTNAAGCDSVVMLHLTINHSNSGIDTQVACDSFTWINGITYYESTNTPTFTLTNAAGCDSVVTLHLTIKHSTTAVDTHVACDTYTWINGVTYTESTNTPTFTLTNAVGCDSVVTLHLTINHSNSSIDTQVACDSYTWINGVIYYECTNTPTYTLTNAAGCDSIVTLHLTIKHSSYSVDTHVACDSFTWIDGTTYTESTNTPTYTLTNAAGCDSVVTLHLTINHSNSGIDTQVACDSYTWIDGNTYTESTNTPMFTLTNATGCDSVVTLHLTINHSTTGIDTQVACDTYTWINGVTYTESTDTPTFTLTNAVGCDSVVALHLTIKHSTFSVDTQVACDSFTWINGVTYYASTNTPTHTLTNAMDCDSIVMLHLTINHSTTAVDTQVACDSYTWIDGVTYTESTNTPTYTLTNAAGCDSVVTLHLTIGHPNSGIDTQVACDSYTWIDGITYTESTNTPMFTLTNAAGCDSVVTLHLTIKHSTTGIDTQVACDTYTWIDGNTYTTSTNTPTFILTNTAGCDSVVTLHLTVNHANSGVDTQVACDSYTWINGNTYTESTNTPTFTLTNAVGCDSVVTLHLTINHSTTAVDTHVACDSYTWIDDSTYTESTNTPTYTLTNAAGCDSVVTLHLTINHSNSGIDMQVACDSYMWIDGNTYTESTNTPTYMLTNTSGCDSVVTLHLTINHSTTAIDTQVACDSYTWMDGNTYTESTNTPTFTLTNAVGCDSVVTLHLTIKHSTTRIDTQVACDSFTWIDGVTYTESTNTATYTLMNAVGCDSVITLHLTINHSNTVIDTQVACDSYTWIDGATYTGSTNTPTYTLTNAAGCDSVVTLHLTINHSNSGIDTQVACDSYTWIDGTTYTESTDTPTFTLTNAVGCDSIVTLHLTINHSTTGVDTQVACDTYTWIDDSTYAESTDTPMFTLTNAVGCDSVVTLHLTIKPSTFSVDTQVACDSFTWINGVTYYESTNTPTHTLTNAMDCDSIVTLHLTINHSTTAVDTQVACDSYTWIDGVTYTESTNTPTYTFTNAAGCDSVVTLHLTINHSNSGIDTQIACDSYTWINDTTYTESTNTPTVTLTNAAGCDSTVTLQLTIFHSDSVAVDSVVFENALPFEWNSVTFMEAGTQSVTLQNIWGCDSVVVMTLHVPVVDEKSCPAAPTVTDHEGNVYATVQIGNQCWMRDNLRTTTSPSTGTYIVNNQFSSGTSIIYTNSGKMARWYNNDSVTYAPMNYGLLYNWNAAMDTFNTEFGETSINSSCCSNMLEVSFPGHRRGICPEGWHIPSNAEWNKMERTVSGSDWQTSYETTYYWRGNHAGKLAGGDNWSASSISGAPGDYSSADRNSSGFAALPAGYCFYYFSAAGDNVFFWTSSRFGSCCDAFDRSLYYKNAGVANSYDNDIHLSKSVRCIRDAEDIVVVDERSCPAAPTVTDHEGNVYATVQIGNQCWMRENLRTVTSPSTGTYLIAPVGTNDTYTGKQASWYNNDSATYEPYGLLYNWNAAADTFNTAYGELSVNTNSSNAVSVTFNSHRRGICPEGWHLPSDAEWNTMERTVSGSDWQTNYETTYYWRGNHAGKLAGSDNWGSSSTSGTPGDYSYAGRNSSGFSILPAGYCEGNSYGAFDYVGYKAAFWSSAQSSSGSSYSRLLDYGNAGVSRSHPYKNIGCSVRCLRDAGTAVIDSKSCTAAPTVTDHEGNVYATVQIGDQCWMRENLRTTTSSSSGTYLVNNEFTSGSDIAYTSTGKMARWYNNDSATYAPKNYGLLYNWNAAVDTFNTAYGELSVNTNISNAVSVSFSGHRRGICPAGWHLPSNAEWIQLTNYVSSQSEYVCGDTNIKIAKALADSILWYSSTTYCAVGNNRSMNNATGFGALPAGSYSDGFHYSGSSANFWTSNQYGSNSATTCYLYSSIAGVYHSSYSKYDGRSVRCLRDAGTAVIDSKSCTTTPTVTDHEGNVYATVQIGDQCWMRENLRTTKLADGTSIQLGGDSTSYIIPYYYDYNNSDFPLVERGYLYNWTAAMLVCPEGWHVPRDDEWAQLINYIGSVIAYQCGGDSTYTAKSLASKTGWYSTMNTCAVGNDPNWNNATGFSAIPAGFCFGNPPYGSKVTSYFWSSTAYDMHTALCYDVDYRAADVHRFDPITPYGISVRCLRDSENTSAPPADDSQPCRNTPTVTDVDGNIYNTVQIGQQCWMKENLRTTKYADGLIIPIGTDTSSTTAYRYCPANNENNVLSYGYLYNWPAIMRISNSSSTNPSGVQGVCPIGWHLPSNEEWIQLASYVASQPAYFCEISYNIAKSLATTTDWGSDTNICSVGNDLNANNTTGFSALPAGYYYGHYANFGSTAVFWSATETGDRYVRYREFSRASATMPSNYVHKKFYGKSVRCLRNEPCVIIDDKSCPNTPTVTDHESNVYATVKIGEQCWMRDNLRTTTSPSTGTYLIPSASTGYTYTGKQARWYNNDSATYAPLNYGLLYNWNAAVDTFNTAYGETSVNDSSSRALLVSFTGHRRGICPVGWHLPSNAEWTQLINYVCSQSEYVCGGTINYIAKALADSVGWNSYNGTCRIGNNHSTNNATGFSAVPAGCHAGSFYYTGEDAYFWCSTEFSNSDAYDRYLGYNNPVVYNYNIYKYSGYSVRCLRDETSTAALPTVTTDMATTISSTSATSGGNVTSDGGANVTARGVCWSISHNPTIEDAHTADSLGTGSFTSNLTGLIPNTTYYVRAYATNSAGTAYGEEVSFTTHNIAAEDAQPCPGMTTVTDVDGNIYNTVRIGGQCWMKENLRTTKYADGTAIPAGGDYSSSYNPYYYDYSSSSIALVNRGYLYNWPAVMHGAASSSANPSGVQGICPSGWHVPSEAEWTGLEDYVGSQSQFLCGSNSAYIAKALASTTGWDYTSGACVVGSNQSINNSTGFSVFPAGTYWCDFSFHYSNSGFNTCLWSSTGNSNYEARGYFLSRDGSVMSHSSVETCRGYSVRCLWDSIVETQVSLPAVTTDSVTGLASFYATTGGNVTSSGGGIVTARGVCWSTEQNPTIDDNYSSGGQGAGTFTIIITGLSPATTYYVRAYATNSEGTVYGEEWSFTTTVPEDTMCPQSVMDIDGNTYSTVRIGGQCWMRENLRTTKYADGSPITYGNDYYSNSTGCWYYPNNDSTNKQAYGLLYNWSAVMHGMASSDATPSGVQGICPDGWHVPSEAEWKQLTDYVSSQSEYWCDGDRTKISKALASPIGWGSCNSTCSVCNQSPNNATGFCAMPAGYGDWGFGNGASFRSSTAISLSKAKNLWIGRDNSTIEYTVPDFQNSYSVRCLHDEEQSLYFPSVSTEPVTDISSTSAVCGGNVTSDNGSAVIARGVCWSILHNPTVSDAHSTDGAGEGSFTSAVINLSPNNTYYVRAYASTAYGTVYGNEVSIAIPVNLNGDEYSCPNTPILYDADGNVYNTVQLGEQCWMRDNLRTTKYADGSSIAFGNNNYSSNTGHWYYPDGDTTFKSTYGLLYNWPAVMCGSPSSETNPSGVQGICPTGWHVPSVVEWKQMTDYVSSQSQYWCEGDSSQIAKSLASTSGWLENNSSSCSVEYMPGNNNATFFGALPAGAFFGDDYEYLAKQAFYWTTVQYDNDFVYFWGIYNGQSSFYSNMSYYCSRWYVGHGYSVRCLRDEDCSPNTSEFSTTSCGEYTWNGVSYTQSGDYTQTFINAMGCDSVVTMHLTVNEDPQFQLTATENVICVGGTTVITAESTGWNNADVNYGWTCTEMGTSFSFLGSEYTFTAETAGVYTFNVTAFETTSGCMATNDLTITVNADPATSIVTVDNAVVCDGSQVTLTVTNTNANATYIWEKNGVVIPGANGAVIYDSPMSVDGNLTNYVYTVIAELPMSGCTSAASSNAVVAAIPIPTVVVSVEGNTTVCAGGSAMLHANITPASTNYSYQWYKDNVLIVGATEADYIASEFARETAYNFRVVVTVNSGCHVTAYAPPITFVADPYVEATISNNITCIGGTATLTAIVNGGVADVDGYTFEWYRDNAQLVGNDPEYITSANDNVGDYTYWITVISDYGCQSTSNIINHNVVADPVVTISVASGYPTTVCNGGSSMLKANVTGGYGNITYQWYKNGAILAGENNQFLALNYLIYGANDTYTVEVTQTGVDCSNSASVALDTLVTVASDYTVVISGYGNVCEGGTLTLNAFVNGVINGDVLNYNWYRISNGTSTLINDANTSQYQTSDFLLGDHYEYYVIAVSSISGCSTVSNSVPCNVVPNPTVVVQGPHTVCEGGDLTLNAFVYGGVEGAGYTYTWNWTGAATGTATTVVPSFTPNLVANDVATPYYFTVTINRNDNTGCTATSNAFEVNVNPVPTVSVTADNAYVCQNGNVTLTAHVSLVGAYNYVWTINGEQQVVNAATVTIPMVTTNAINATVTVSATSTSASCSTTSSITVPVVTTVTDIDGNTYNTIQIGGQCWMKENLRTTKFADGTFIEEGSSTSSTIPYRYIPDDNASNVPTYGYLYNWAAVMHGASSNDETPSGIQGVCPDGWHLPSNAEWAQLTDYVSSQSQYWCDNNSSNIAKALSSTTGWFTTTTNCDVGNDQSSNNATGFNVLPAGYATYGSGDFNSKAYLWSTTLSPVTGLGYFSINFYSSAPDCDFACDFCSYSVRCLHDESYLQYFPTVSTSDVVNVTSSSATCGGNVISTGNVTVNSRGVCWGILHNPTIKDDHTIDGSGAGSFTSSITGLKSNFTYYIRAYATNSFGTVYGNEVSVIIPVNSNGDAFSCPGAPTVSDDDGNVYNTVQIGGQCWMRENLRTTKYPDGTTIPEGDITTISTTGCWYYPNEDSSYRYNYGLLYNWFAVMNGSSSIDSIPSGVQGICPAGWHVPSNLEWIQLTNYLHSQSQYWCNNDSDNIAKALAAPAWWLTNKWLLDTCYVCNNPYNNNSTGFGALPAGTTNIYSKDFCSEAYFWSATEDAGNSVHVFRIVGALATEWLNSTSKYYGSSVRCLRDENTTDGQPCPGTPTVTDIDGNVYNTVKIGEQCWMKENLRTTRYADGTEIYQGVNSSSSTGYWYYPNNDATNKFTYGLLYNWTAVMNGASPSYAIPSGVQGICPIGWHVPSNAEWTNLTDYVRSQSQYRCDNTNSYIAKALSSKFGWVICTYNCAVGNNPNSNNITGFSVLPAGFYSETFSGIGYSTYFWSSTEASGEKVRGRCIFNVDALVYSGSVADINKSHGFSIRCLRD